MSKRILLIVVSALIVTLSHCDSSEIYLGDKTENKVGPGFRYLQFMDESTPRHIVAIEMDLTVEGNEIQSVLANDGLDEGFEYVDEMADRKNKEDNLVIGAINADYFGINEPENPYTFLTNSKVKNGSPVFTGFEDRTSFGIGGNRAPFIEMLKVEGNLITEYGSDFELSGLNIEREPGSLVLYNEYFGSHVDSDNSVEWLLQPEEDFQVNTRQRFRVKQISDDEQMEIKEGHKVLSAAGELPDGLKKSLTEDSEIELELRIHPDTDDQDYFVEEGISQLTGAGPHLLHNGEHATDDFLEYEGFSERHSGQRHPRSAVGFNKDTTKVYFVAIDGRYPGFSEGATLAETADIMKKLGAHNAVNLDGGGSTSLIVRDEMVNQHDEEGSKRQVANALLAVTSRSFNELADQIEFTSSSEIEIDLDQPCEPEIEVRDEWGYKLDIPNNALNWEIKGMEGTIQENGDFTPANRAEGALIADYNGLSDTLFVKVK